MSEPSVLRFPNGDRKYPSHVELEKQGWIRGEYPNKNCERCGKIFEWGGRPSDRATGSYLIFPARQCTSATEMLASHREFPLGNQHADG
jgi:hypothetical protein